MFDLSKICDLSKKFALPDTLLKSKNYCIHIHDSVKNSPTVGGLFSASKQRRLSAAWYDTSTMLQNHNRTKMKL